MRGNKGVSPEQDARPGELLVRPTEGLAPLAEQMLAVLPLIPKILIAVGVIQARLDGVRKSHLTVEEFAHEVGRAPYTVRTWIKEKRVVAIRVPGTGARGRLLIPHEELAKLVAAGKTCNLAAVID